YVGEIVQAEKEDIIEPLLRGNEVILLVEDEPTILEMTSIMLENLGYTVLTAVTPGEAIRLAGEHNAQIDLLLTDVVMPGMNGRDLAQNMMHFHSGIKHLFMSGYTADIIAHQDVLDEGVNFIQKPFSAKSLAEKVREALSRNH
ncbi:MAG: hybrid sensor histidine kinase/response regulator, partial [Deltaproteobacteria bacterium HGW-Deltaproteobacteria-1]